MSYIAKSLKKNRNTEIINRPKSDVTKKEARQKAFHQSFKVLLKTDPEVNR